MWSGDSTCYFHLDYVDRPLSEVLCLKDLSSRKYVNPLKNGTNMF